MKIYSPNTLVRAGITRALSEVSDGERVIVRAGATSDGVRGVRLQGNVKLPENVKGRVYELVALTEDQITELEKEHDVTDSITD